MNKRPLRLSTRSVHAGEDESRALNSVTQAIFQSSTYVYEDAQDYHGILYTRLSNTPNHETLRIKMASLEQTESALALSSGMAAISCAILAALGKSGHLLTQKTLYGGTHSLVYSDLSNLGHSATAIDLEKPDEWEKALQPNTRAIHIEAISNPLLEIPDFEKVIAFARKHKLITLIDSTFACPINFQPARIGFQVVIHSATKYLNGHTDVVAGAICSDENFIRKAKKLSDHLGCCLDPHAAFLLNRGIKTICLRVARQNQNAQAIAEFLQSHPSIQNVYYPGLPDHPHFDRAQKWLRGYGGIVSFELKGGLHEADAFLDRLQLPARAPSLGGVESLVTRPASSSHLGLTPEERSRAGISDSLIRLSVGIEDVEDLIADLDQALER